MADNLEFGAPVQRLQDMAAFRVALDLWLYYIECEFKGLTNNILNRVCVADSYTVRNVHVLGMVNVLKLPKIIEDSIDLNVKSICARVVRLSAHYQQVLLGDLEIERNWTSIVWQPDGTIDYGKTIPKMIEGSKLDQRRRFTLMCEYCMENEIRKVWPELEDRQFLDDAHFESNPMLVYWNCVMAEDFSKMQVESMAAARNRLLEQTRVSNQSAMEYFFSQMCTDDRINYGIRWIERDGIRVAKFLMSMYTESEQRRLFFTSDFFIKLITIFASSASGTEADVKYSLLIWFRVRSLVNGTQFISMLKKIGKERPIYKRDNQIHQLLVDLWRHSPRSLKEYVYKLPTALDFLDKLCIRPKYVVMFGGLGGRYREDGILIEILIDAEPELRARVWRRYWNDIVTRSRPDNLKAILKLCVSKDEMDQHKMNAILTLNAVKQYLTELIVDGNYSELREFLDVLDCGDKGEMDLVKRRLIRDKSDLTSIIKKCEPTDERANALNEFLVDMFGTDTEGLIEFKVKIILACLTPYDLCVREQLDGILFVAERLCDEQTLAQVKSEILKRCRVVGLDPQYSYCFELPEWPILLRWCLGSDEQVQEFNRSMDIEN